jgi:TonB family protein
MMEGPRLVANTGRTSTQMDQDGPITTAPGHRRRDAWLLSGDDLLLIELGPLLGEHYRTHPVDNIEALSRASASGWMLLLDVIDLPDAQAQAVRLATRYPLAPVIVFCADGELDTWKNLPAARTVCAVLERSAIQGPPLVRALAEAERRLDAASTAITSTSMRRLEMPADDGAPDRRPLLLGIAAVALLGIGALLWWRSHATNPPAPAAAASLPSPAPAATAKATPAQPTSAATPTAPAAPAVRGVEELLSDARSAFRDDRMQLPRVDGAPQGDSALELYSQVLKQEPKNDEALDGLRRLLAVTRDRVQVDIRTDRLDEAALLIAAYRNAGLPSDDLARMEREVNAARPRQLMQKARAALAAGDTAAANNYAGLAANAGADASQVANLRKEAVTRTAEASLAQLATQARAAIAAGNLLEPSGDSARARLQAMQQLARGQPFTQAVTRELQQALLARAQLATRSNDPRQAEPWLAAAAELGGSPDLLAAQREQQAAVEETTRRAAAPAPTAPKVAAAPGPVPGWYPARARRPLAVAYPPAALSSAQSGYVVVEFTLGPDGRAVAPRVIEAEPTGVFDSAALNAVRPARFDITPPAGQDPTGLRARLRVTFRYQDVVQSR